MQVNMFKFRQLLTYTNDRAGNLEIYLRKSIATDIDKLTPHLTELLRGLHEITCLKHLSLCLIYKSY